MFCESFLTITNCQVAMLEPICWMSRMLWLWGGRHGESKK